MKRDLDLVRAILLALEAHPHGFAPVPFTVRGYEQEVIGHHIWLMAQGQLVTAMEVTSSHDTSPTSLPGAITWQGHEFLDAARNSRVWQKVKTELKDRALSLPFTLVQELAIKIAKSLAGLDE